MVKPSIYSSRVVNATTNYNGVAVISGFEKSFNGTVFIGLRIPTYGLSIDLRTISSSYGKITIRLPYECVNGTEINVVDEYSSAFDGFFKLEHGGVTLISGAVSGGVLKLIYDRYPLLLKTSNLIFINYDNLRNESRPWEQGSTNYRIRFYSDPGFSNELSSIKLDLETIRGGRVRLDLHPPKITDLSLKKTSETLCIHWFELHVEVNDGVNTPGVGVSNVKIYVPEIGRYVDHSVEKQSSGNEVVFKVKFHVSSCIIRSVVLEELQVKDSSGKSTVVYDVVFNVVSEVETDFDGGGAPFTNSTEGGVALNTFKPGSNGSRSWFSPVEVKERGFNVMYLFGFAISAGIVVYERFIKRRRIG